MRRPPALLRAPLAASVILSAAACAPVPDGSAEDARTLTVFAAASLTGAFEELGGVFEERNPGTAVEFSFAGSSDLAAQVNAGAPADVFASASTATMDLVVDAGGAGGEPVVFARNVLEIAVPPDDPAGIGSLDDLAEDGVSVALCAEEVPCGAAARAVLDASGVEFEPATLERDVKAALTKVELGEVDAALVYTTDVAAASGRVRGVPFPEAEEAVNDYPVAVLADAPEAGLAASWVELVTSPEGAEVLSGAGFRTP
ncbi:molybdate ABC transporter substrate-binding protein [Actinorugispora endophytica]|uniref:Molybdate transport system substrate-binding protein n=1 Tax=Actinorugispora endophytica TaxID=1605990 RepID=A0A4R6V0E3_9ACTN|nr:molybdate ABC transporter substrate-binding protein [Actinorugispora endophytica]TDQ53155.1 molybdate transport system substrate-binding protein [Actinorugispora endophytica]